jgi:hypothetical protein
MGEQMIRYGERPELWAETATITREVWPEYNLHSEDPNRYWFRLLEEFPEYQFVLYDDEQQEVIAEGHTIPCDWDGTPNGLGDGIDAITGHEMGRQPDHDLAVIKQEPFKGSGHMPAVLDHPGAPIVQPACPAQKIAEPVPDRQRSARRSGARSRPPQPRSACPCADRSRSSPSTASPSLVLIVEGGRPADMS